MPAPSRIPTPLPLRVRRLYVTVLPIVTLLASVSVAAWIWTGQARTGYAIGEVAIVRAVVESEYPGLLEELPRPVAQFDTVRSGQVVARIDTSVDEAELRRVELEVAHLRQPAGGEAAPGSTTAPSMLPATSQLEWYETRIEHLRAKIKQKDLKSPISGVVMELLKRPGETATLGKPIMVIAAEQSDSIVGYIRQDQMVRVTKGMAVEIQSRTRPSKTFRSTLLSVGAQVEPLPTRHWRNPAIAEWALPLQVAMPANSDLRPGELVDLVIRPAAR